MHIESTLQFRKSFPGIISSDPPGLPHDALSLHSSCFSAPHTTLAGLNNFSLSPFSPLAPLPPLHTHEHGHMGTPCRYRCVSSINPMPALLAGQDMGLQLTKCPPDPGHLWVALPYQYHRSLRGQARSCTPNYSTCYSSERKAVLPSFINV